MQKYQHHHHHHQNHQGSSVVDGCLFLDSICDSATHASEAIAAARAASLAPSLSPNSACSLSGISGRPSAILTTSGVVCVRNQTVTGINTSNSISNSGRSLNNSSPFPLLGYRVETTLLSTYNTNTKNNSAFHSSTGTSSSSSSSNIINYGCENDDLFYRGIAYAAHPSVLHILTTSQLHRLDLRMSSSTNTSSISAPSSSSSSSYLRPILNARSFLNNTSTYTQPTSSSCWFTALSNPSHSHASAMAAIQYPFHFAISTISCSSGSSSKRTAYYNLGVHLMDERYLKRPIVIWDLPNSSTTPANRRNKIRHASSNSNSTRSNTTFSASKNNNKSQRSFSSSSFLDTLGTWPHYLCHPSLIHNTLSSSSSAPTSNGNSVSNKNTSSNQSNTSPFPRLPPSESIVHGLQLITTPSSTTSSILGVVSWTNDALVTLHQYDTGNNCGDNDIARKCIPILRDPTHIDYNNINNGSSSSKEEREERSKRREVYSDKTDDQSPSASSSSAQRPPLPRLSNPDAELVPILRQSIKDLLLLMPTEKVSTFGGGPVYNHFMPKSPFISIPHSTRQQQQQASSITSDNIKITKRSWQFSRRFVAPPSPPLISSLSTISIPDLGIFTHRPRRHHPSLSTTASSSLSTSSSSSPLSVGCVHVNAVAEDSVCVNIWWGDKRRVEAMILNNDEFDGHCLVEGVWIGKKENEGVSGVTAVNTTATTVVAAGTTFTSARTRSMRTKRTEIDDDDEDDNNGDEFKQLATTQTIMDETVIDDSLLFDDLRARDLGYTFINTSTVTTNQLQPSSSSTSISDAATADLSSVIPLPLLPAAGLDSSRIFPPHHLDSSLSQASASMLYLNAVWRHVIWKYLDPKLRASVKPVEEDEEEEDDEGEKERKFECWRLAVKSVPWRMTLYELHRAWVSYSSTVTYDSLPSTTTSSTNTCHVPRVPSLKTAVGVSCSSFSRQLLSAAVGGGGGTPGGSGLQQQQQQQQGSCEIKLMEPLLKWELDGRKRHLIGQQQQQEEEKEETKSNNNIDKSPEEVAKELLIGLFPERRHVAANVSDGDEDDEFGPNAVQAYISASRSNALEWMASELALSSRLVHEVPRHSVLPPSLSAVNIPVDTNNNEESSLFSSSQMSFNYWDIYSQGSYNAAGGPSSLSSSYPFSSQQQLQSQGTVVKQDGNDVTISYAPAPVVAIPNRFSMPQHPNSNSSIPSVVAAANNISAPYSTTANAISSPRPLLQPFQPTNSSSSSLFPLVTLSRAASELRTRWLDQDKYYSGKYYGIASTTDRSSKDRRSRRGLKRRYEERMKERSQSILEDYLASQQQQQHSETHFSQVESQIPTFSNSSLSSSPIRSASQPLPSTVVPPVIVRASSVGVPIFSSTASFSQPVRPLSSSNKKKRKKGF